MQEDLPPSSEPEVSHSGYNVNLVWASDDTGPGTICLVTAREDSMLDEEAPQSRAPGMGQLGSEENLGCPITKKE